jgi:hypothetical protein
MHKAQPKLVGLVQTNLRLPLVTLRRCSPAERRYPTFLNAVANRDFAITQRSFNTWRLCSFELNKELLQ